MDAKYILNKEQSDDLYHLMKFIHDTFVKYDIPYFIVGGTLLGAVRHQGVIPHDDDGDICIFRKDVPKLRKLVKYFDMHGYNLEEGLTEGNKASSCTKSKDSCTWFIDGKHEGSLGCDVFVMDIDGDRVTYADPYWKTADNGGKRCYFPLDHVFPLVPYRYGNFYLYGPRNAIQHLNNCYGVDWNAKGQTMYDHRTGQWTRGVKRDLNTNDFLTLQPPDDTMNERVDHVVCDKNVPTCGTYRSFLKPSTPSTKKSATSKASSKSSRKSPSKKSKKSKKSVKKGMKKTSKSRVSKKKSSKKSKKSHKKKSSSRKMKK